MTVADIETEENIREVILGVSNGVMFEECAWASRGQGAFLNSNRPNLETVSVLAANNPEMYAQVSRFLRGID